MNQGNTIRTNTKLEVVKRVNVDKLELGSDGERKLDNRQHVMIVVATLVT